MQYSGHASAYTKKLFVTYQKFRHNWVSFNFLWQPYLSQRGVKSKNASNTCLAFLFKLVINRGVL